MANTGSQLNDLPNDMSFAQANGGGAMIHSKKSRAGRAERAALLEQLGFTAPPQLLGPPDHAVWSPDDLLDACIACWTAERIVAGAAIVEPRLPPLDERGLRMEIWR